MVMGVEPAVVGMAEAVERANIDHAVDLGRRGEASSVSDVTGTSGISQARVAQLQSPVWW
jgi:hypothetical protein